MRLTPVFDVRIANLLMDQHRRRGSGILKATRGKLRRLFCIEGGLLVFAASNVVEEQLEEMLRKRGVFDEATDARVPAPADGRRGLTSLLLERQLVRAPELRAAIEAVVEELLFSTMAWPDGATEFTEGKPNLEGEITVALSPIGLMLRYAGSHPVSVEEIRARIGSPDLRLERAPEATEPEDLGEPARAILERCGEPASVASLLKPSADAGGEALRALYGLFLAGFLVPAQALAARLERSPETPLSREECMERLGAAEASDHYAVLGLERGAARQKIREAYYSIARRYHPDRFRSGPLRDLHPRFEAFFSAVTEAYNVLWSPEARAQYDSQLDAAAQAEGPKPSETAQIARQNFLRGRALLERRRWQEATTFLENAVQLDPNRAEYALELGRILTRNPRRREEAEQHLRRAVELEPATAAGFVALGRLYKIQGRWAEAVDRLEETLRWDPGNSEATSLLNQLRLAARQPGADGVLRALFSKG